MIGIKQQPKILIISAIFLTATIMAILHSIFKLGCGYFSSSKRVLFQWKVKVPKFYVGRRAKEMTQVVRSLRLISFPAGGAGIVDEEIEINYLGKLQSSLVDSSIARGKLL